MYTASLKRSENYKAQPYQYASSSKQILKAKAKPFPPCTHCGFNDHRPDDYRIYTECEIYRSYDHFTSGHNHVIHIRGGVLAESSQTTESSIGVKCNTCGSTIHSTTDHNEFDHFKRGKFYAKADDGYFLGYYFVSKAFRVFNMRRQQVEETYHVTFDESMEAIRFTNALVDKIGIDDSSRYPPNEIIHKDDPSRQYQANSNILYYVIPHGRSLTELTQENHVPEVIALNEHEIPHTKDAEGPPDLINTEGTPEQNVQDEQIITKPTKGPSGLNTKVSVSINESLLLNIPQPYISNQASTSSHPVPQDRWSRDQHIKLVNIIGNPSEGMLTRSMAAKLTAASASECLFADFLFEIEPKKVFRNKKDEHDTTTKNKVRLVAQGYSQEEGINYDETFAPVARMEAIRIFLALATYMNFKVYQMDVKSAFPNGKLKEEVYVKQPPSFESSEFPEYVCKLNKALCGLKKHQGHGMRHSLLFLFKLSLLGEE
ncbi:retrovirus-related pol polyprotein from transposon TNT 1-94 [Tanacetum coccineum]|uniref:Retrovirus-related pol polyprotein from transposon TNT 1-94 n=1 Tax=Tanacetum coccineum TaxID=301880 RepID=A0ABQ4YFK0_9ASTR